MFVCMFVCLCVCMYVWMDGSMYACMHACMYVCMDFFKHVYIYIIYLSRRQHQLLTPGTTKSTDPGRGERARE